MSNMKTSTVEIGTDAAPIALGNNGGATDVGTWTHNLGQRAVKVEALYATSRAPVQHDEAGLVAAAAQTVQIAQPSVNAITVTNLSNNSGKNIILRVTFEHLSAGEADGVPATAVVLS